MYVTASLAVTTHAPIVIRDPTVPVHVVLALYTVTVSELLHPERTKDHLGFTESTWQTPIAGTASCVWNVVAPAHDEAYPVEVMNTSALEGRAAVSSNAPSSAAE